MFLDTIKKFFGFSNPLPVLAPQQLQTDVEIVARTIWGEARNQGVIGMQAIANVIMRRARLGGWWGNTPSQVCLKFEQFSCRNAGNVNLSKLLSVTTADAQYCNALTIAQDAISGHLEDVTCNADSYEVRGTNASWTYGLRPVKSIGIHDFYITRK